MSLALVHGQGLPTQCSSGTNGTFKWPPPAWHSHHLLAALLPFPLSSCSLPPMSIAVSPLAAVLFPQEPEGLLEVHVVEAANLPRMDTWIGKVRASGVAGRFTWWCCCLAVLVGCCASTILPPYAWPPPSGCAFLVHIRAGSHLTV